MERETGEIKLIKKVYTVKELAEVLSIGLNKAYNLVNDGDIRSLKVKEEEEGLDLKDLKLMGGRRKTKKRKKRRK